MPVSSRNVYILDALLLIRARYTRKSYIDKKTCKESDYIKEMYVYSKCLYPQEISVSSMSDSPNLRKLHAKFIYLQKSLCTKQLYKRDVCILEMSVSSRNVCNLNIESPNLHQHEIRLSTNKPMNKATIQKRRISTRNI